MSVTIRPVGQSTGEVPSTSSAVSSGRAIVAPMTASSRRPYGSAATAAVQPRSHDVCSVRRSSEGAQVTPPHGCESAPALTPVGVSRRLAAARRHPACAGRAVPRARKPYRPRSPLRGVRGGRGGVWTSSARHLIIRTGEFALAVAVREADGTNTESSPRTDPGPSVARTRPCLRTSTLPSRMAATPSAGSPSSKSVDASRRVAHRDLSVELVHVLVNDEAKRAHGSNRCWSLRSHARSP